MGMIEILKYERNKMVDWYLTIMFYVLGYITNTGNNIMSNKFCIQDTEA